MTLGKTEVYLLELIRDGKFEKPSGRREEKAFRRLLLHRMIWAMYDGGYVLTEDGKSLLKNEKPA